MGTFQERLNAAFADKQAAERRAGRRYTKTDFARQVGVERNTADGWFNRGVRPREFGVLSAAATELGVSAEWLGGGGDSHAFVPDQPDGGGKYDAVAGSLDRTLPRVMGGLPYAVRVWLQQELLDYAKAQVPDDLLRSARDLYERPEVFSFYAGGVPQARTEEEVLLGMRAMAAAVRAMLRRRGYKLDPDTPY